MANPLDLIEARSLAGSGTHTRADNLALVAALRAVLALAAEWHQDYKEIDTRWSTDDFAVIRRDGRDDAAHEIETAIREALG